MTEQEFDSRVRQMEGKMYRMARSMLRTDHDCADAIQNTVFAAWGGFLPCGRKNGLNPG